MQFNVRNIVHIFILLAPFLAFAEQTVVSDMRVWAAPDHTRLVLNLSSTDVKYKIFLLTKPDRLVVDLSNTHLSEKVKSINISAGIIKRLRRRMKNEKNLRIVLDLEKSVRATSFILKASDKYDPRLVFDLRSSDPVAKRTPKELQVVLEKPDDLHTRFFWKNYIEENPDGYKNLVAIGEAKAKENRYPEALAFLNAAKNIKVKYELPDSSIYNSLGWVQFLEGDIELAKSNINKALEDRGSLTPSVGEAAYNNLGIIYMHINRDDMAKSYFNKAIKEYKSSYAQENLELIDKFATNRESIFGNESIP